MSNVDFMRKKKAEFINLPNIIKGKVGVGGLSEAILTKAQQLLDEHKMDFMPTVDDCLGHLQAAIDVVRSGEPYDNGAILNQMLLPCVELNSHGRMFHFDLVSTISNKMILFIKDVKQPDEDMLEIMGAYHATIQAIVLGKIYGEGGARGQELLQTLSEACDRYFRQRA